MTARRFLIPIYVISLGCPKNFVDTERLLGAFPGEPRLVARPEDAAVVLVNTCGFIRPAVEESLSEILSAVKAIRTLDPKPLLAVAGCLVSRYGEDLKEGLPEVDVWLSTHELPDWPGRVAQALKRAAKPYASRLFLEKSTSPAFSCLSGL